MYFAHHFIKEAAYALKVSQYNFWFTTTLQRDLFIPVTLMAVWKAYKISFYTGKLLFKTKNNNNKKAGLIPMPGFL